MAGRVRVREISNDEGNRLKRIVRRGGGSVVTWRRAQMVLWSAQGMNVAQIAGLAFTSEDRVRDVLHNFNADGFESLYPRYAGGRPRRRLRATYHRTSGVRHLFAALELGSDKMYGHIKKRKRRGEFLQFCRYLRSLHPAAGADRGRLR